jgi:hypothetical protein
MHYSTGGNFTSILDIPKKETHQTKAKILPTKWWFHFATTTLNKRRHVSISSNIHRKGT